MFYSHPETLNKSPNQRKNDIGANGFICVTKKKRSSHLDKFHAVFNEIIQTKVLVLGAWSLSTPSPGPEPEPGS